MRLFPSRRSGRQPMGCGRGSAEWEMVEGLVGGGIGEAVVGG